MSEAAPRLKKHPWSWHSSIHADRSSGDFPDTSTGLPPDDMIIWTATLFHEGPLLPNLYYKVLIYVGIDILHFLSKYWPILNAPLRRIICLNFRAVYCWLPQGTLSEAGHSGPIIGELKHSSSSHSYCGQLVFILEKGIDEVKDLLQNQFWPHDLCVSISYHSQQPIQTSKVMKLTTQRSSGQYDGADRAAPFQIH